MNDRRCVNGMPLKRGRLASLKTSSAIHAWPVPTNRSAAGPPYGCMIGGRSSLHELALASDARIVVATELDIFRTSDEASAGTEASPGSAGGRGAAEPTPDALERAESADPSADASARTRSARGPPPFLHAVIPTSSARSSW
jgi:hypothetical protein